MLENIPANEASQIQHIVELTLQQLQYRYPGNTQTLRGVHSKGHGCVTATFEVRPDIAPNLQQGVFTVPGKRFDARVRFSNASVLVTPDSKPGVDPQSPEHGSRGMGVKLLDVDGQMLLPPHGASTQDFLMVNQPVFAFANVEDYEVLSQVLVDHHDNPVPFFGQRLKVPPTTPSEQRAAKTFEIVSRVRSASATANPPAFQEPPASPVDNEYFGASPFLLGPNQVMRFRVRPNARSNEAPNVADPNYLRTALVARLRNKTAGNVVFHFEAQVRATTSINPDVDIENASHDWPEATYPFVPLATITIPLQEFDSPESNERCERLVFTPWHGLTAHQPLGGINRLRRAVYEASAMFRNLPKEPSGI